jgi:hypothetical protein
MHRNFYYILGVVKYDRYNFGIYDYGIYYGIGIWKNWAIFLG